MPSVLIVDDSAIVRKVLFQKLSILPQITTVYSAPDPYIARDYIVKFLPDVVILDIEMPRMDGIQFLQKIMMYMPRPVIILSSLSTSGSDLALKALELGAFDVLSKPGGPFTVEEIIDILYQQILSAAHNSPKIKPQVHNPLQPKPETPLSKVYNSSNKTHKILAIGASTGGTQALQTVLTQLPANIPGTLVVQHMPVNFTKSFANRLNSLCHFEVKEAEHGDSVHSGRVLIAPGDFHMELQRSGANFHVKLHKGPREHYQRPAVDPLFRSVASLMQKDSMGIILTGMGMDGAQGLFEMKNWGAKTIAQDEASSIVWGMPKAAIKLGAAQEVLDLNEIPKKINFWNTQSSI